MPRLSTLLRRSALACAAACAAANMAAAPAGAASLSAAAKCKYPFAGTFPATLTVDGDIPESGQEGAATSPVPLNVKVSVPDTRGTGQAISEGFSLSGEINLRLAVTAPSGQRQELSVKAPFAPVKVPMNTSTGYIAFDLAGTSTLPSFTLDEVGEARVDVISFIPNVRGVYDGEFGDGSLFSTPPTGVDREPFVDSDADPATADIPCRFEPKVDAVNLAKINVGPIACPPVILPPETPTSAPVQSGDIGPTSARLRWTNPPVPRCGTPAASFRITGAGQTVTVPAAQTDALIQGLRPNTNYNFQVVALDDWGGPPSQPLTISVKTSPVICTDDLKPPPTPVALPLGNADIGSTTVTLRWQPGEEGLCPTEDLTSYRITYGGQTVTVPATQNTLLVTGLTPSTAYAFEIRSVAATVSYSRGPLVVNVTTDPAGTGLPDFTYNLTGSTTLKTLTKGTLGLSGAIKAQFTVATGAVSADLTLNDTSGRLVAAGFLPVTAKIGFAPSGKTTGTLLDGVLRTNSKVRIKVKEVKLFGAIPLAGGNNCQTRNLSDINLQSTQPEFLPLSGGPLAGTYKISDLNGCGALNGLVSPLTAGGGNTIALNLTPRV